MKYSMRIIMLVMLLTTACVRQGQDIYKADESGVSRAVEFGTVLNVREVQIKGKNSGIGTAIGAGVGVGGGSYVGKGDGNAWAMAGAAIVGAVAGTVIEQSIRDRNGYEYVVQLQSGETKTVVQEQHDDDIVFKEGAYVMLQYCDSGSHARKCAEGQYQRLLPIKKLPPYVKVKRKYVQTKEVSEYESYKPEKGGDADFELTPLN